jgi:hypothetical protein
MKATLGTWHAPGGHASAMTTIVVDPISDSLRPIRPIFSPVRKIFGTKESLVRFYLLLLFLSRETAPITSSYSKMFCASHKDNVFFHSPKGAIIN